MEFLRKQSRSNGSSSSRRKMVGLLIFIETPSKNAHIVFNTQNVTKSITNPTSSEHNKTPTAEMLSPTSPFETPCLLSSHGLRRSGSPGPLKPGGIAHTLLLLPQTVCTTHGATAFLPLDYVKRMGEYTCATSRFGRTVVKVVHSFDDCILEFPIPPPIGSSEEVEFWGDDYSGHCYQCNTELSSRKTVYMFRDCIFCCYGCRLRACATMYWYEKLMAFIDEDDDDKNINGGGDGAIFEDETDIFDLVC